MGTKRLIESYLDEVVLQLDELSNATSISAATKKRFFSDSQQAFGQSALLLSGGLSFGMYVVIGQDFGLGGIAI